MRRITGRLSLAAVLIVLAGCGDGSDGGAAAESPTPVAAASGDPTGDAAADLANCDGPPRVTLIEPGEEPRSVMELSPTAGDSAAMDMVMNLTTTTTVDGEEAPAMPSPPITIGVAMTVDDVTDDEITMSVTYDRIEVEGGDPAGQAALDSMVGVTGTVTTSRSGAFIDGEVDTEGLDPALAPLMQQLDDQLANLTVPLPTDPVGVGATWNVISSAGTEQFTFCNDFTYRLVEFDGDAYELEVELAQLAQPGTIEQDGSTAELTEGSGAGTGHSSGRLSFPIAVSGSVESVTSTTTVVDDGSAERTVEAETALQMEISPRE